LIVADEQRTAAAVGWQNTTNLNGRHFVLHTPSLWEKRQKASHCCWGNVLRERCGRVVSVSGLQRQAVSVIVHGIKIPQWMAETIIKLAWWQRVSCGTRRNKVHGQRVEARNVWVVKEYVS
jgi:hypothetical protein